MDSATIQTSEPIFWYSRLPTGWSTAYPKDNFQRPYGQNCQIHLLILYRTNEFVMTILFFDIQSI